MDANNEDPPLNKKVKLDEEQNPSEGETAASEILKTVSSTPPQITVTPPVTIESNLKEENKKHSLDETSTPVVTKKLKIDDSNDNLTSNGKSQNETLAEQSISSEAERPESIQKNVSNIKIQESGKTEEKVESSIEAHIETKEVTNPSISGTTVDDSNELKKPPQLKPLRKIPDLNPIGNVIAKPIVKNISVSPANVPSQVKISPVKDGETLSISPPKQQLGPTVNISPSKSPAPANEMSPVNSSPIPIPAGVTISPSGQPFAAVGSGMVISPVKTPSPKQQRELFHQQQQQSQRNMLQQQLQHQQQNAQMSISQRYQIPEGISITAIKSAQPAQSNSVSIKQVVPQNKPQPVSVKQVVQPLQSVVQPTKQLESPQPIPQVKPVQVSTTTTPEQNKLKVDMVKPKIVSSKKTVSPNKSTVESIPTTSESSDDAAPSTQGSISILEQTLKGEKKETIKEQSDNETQSPPKENTKNIKDQIEKVKENKLKEDIEAEEDNTDVEMAEEKKSSEEGQENNNQSSDSDDEDSTGDENEKEKESPKTRRPTRKLPAKKIEENVKSTPVRSLRTRKSILPKTTEVTVKLTRIDDDDAMSPWNLKKLTTETPSASNNASSSDDDDVEEEEEEGGDDDDGEDSNSQDSKSCQSSNLDTPKRRGRPRKDLDISEIEDYTSHDSLHAALQSIIDHEGLESAYSNESEDSESDKPKTTKQLLKRIPFFSRRGGRGGMKGKAIGKNNEFNMPFIERLESDKRFRNDMLRQYQDEKKKVEEKKLEKIAEQRKKMEEKNKALAEKKLKNKIKAEERRRKWQEQKMQKAEDLKKREEAKRLRASLQPPQNFDDDTRMSFPKTPVGKISYGKIENSEDSTPRSESSRKRGKADVIDLDSQKEFSVHNLCEYQWPLQGGDTFMIQEQVAAYLGVKSFKRKYPDLKRRGLEPEERTYICDSGLVSESMIELGLTAVQSAEILDIMFVDFPDKYEEVKKYIREKQARELIDRQRAYYDISISEKTSMDLKDRVVEAASRWNAQFNKMRKEKRQCSLDLQTFIIHYPKNKGDKMTRPLPKVGDYPVAILPGQFCDYYKHYTPTELRYMPMNTVIYGPLKPNEIHLEDMSYSEASQSDTDDSSSSSDSSSGDSSSNANSDSSDSESSGGEDEAPPPPSKTPMRKHTQASSLSRALGLDKTPISSTITPKSNTPQLETNGSKSMPSVDETASATDFIERLNNVENGDEEDDKVEHFKSKLPAPDSKNCKSCDKDSGDMIQCCKCIRYIHPVCLDLTPEMVPHILKYSWQCSDCKTCLTCHNSQDDDKMLFCDLCDRGYHNYCIGLDKIPTGRWHCKECAICAVCNATDPNPEWEHEYKKGVKGQSIYLKSYCTPCFLKSDFRPQRR